MQPGRGDALSKCAGQGRFPGEFLRGPSFCLPLFSETMPRGLSDDKQAKNGGLMMLGPEVGSLPSFIRGLARCVPGLPWLFIHAGDDEEPRLNSITVLARAAFRSRKPLPLSSLDLSE